MSRTTLFHQALGVFRRPYTAVSNFNTCSRVICNLSRISCGGFAHTSRLASSRSPDKKAVFTSPFLKRKPRYAESCKMSCLEKRLSVGDLERVSVKSGSVKPFTTRRAFDFPSVNPTHRHDSLFRNACSLADRDHIIADPLIHFFALSCSKLCTLLSRKFS